jgi:hypothetical protein
MFTFTQQSIARVAILLLRPSRLIKQRMRSHVTAR